MTAPPPARGAEGRAAPRSTAAQDFDVAVVGAGPAGAWCARRLAERGARVALVDGSHPREKPCGGGLSARALRILQRLPVGSLPPAADVRTARFAAEGELAAISLPPLHDGTPALVIVSRRDFDSALLDAATRAGATFVARRAVDVARTGAGWTVTTEAHRITSGWLVGADGANSLVRRRVCGPFPRAALSVASGYYVEGETREAIDIEFTAHPAGYLWSFPRPSHLAVGVCAQADTSGSRPLLAQAGAWIERHVAKPWEMTRYSWPIPSLGVEHLRNERPAGDRWLLVGDAAGLVDPITREGIFFALQSAEIAASSLGAADPEARYAAAVRQTIHREIARAARLRTRFFAPAFSRLLVRSLRRSDGIARIMAGLVSGEQTYEGLRRRLLFTGEWRLAAEYLKLGSAGRSTASPPTDPAHTE